MGIFEKAVADIKVPSKKVKQADIARAAKVIYEQGFKVPIVIDEDNNVISGQDRLLAAIELKMGSVPVIVAEAVKTETVKPKKTRKAKDAG